MRKVKKTFSIRRFSVRNKPVNKVGLDTDNCFSWIENEKSIQSYKPAIAKRGNIIGFSES